MRDEGSPGCPHRKDSPIRSRFAHDPEMRELVPWFLGDLERRVEAIQSALDQHDAARLRVIAHQLAGSAKGYGFDQIGDAARKLESSVRFACLQRDANSSLGDAGGSDDGLADEMSLAGLVEKAEDLIVLCRRAIDGGNGDER